jgi:hypothetical protein
MSLISTTKRKILTNNRLIEFIYLKKIRVSGNYTGHAKPGLTQAGLPNPVYSFLVKVKAHALAAGDNSNEYALLAAWIGIWDYICMTTRGHVCPKPDSIQISGREELGNFFGVKLEFRNGRSCGSEFCPMCMMRRIETLDLLTAKDFHSKQLYGYFQKSYGTVEVDDVDTSYAATLNGIAKNVMPVYGMRRLEAVSDDTWEKRDNVWVRKYETIKSKDTLVNKFCGYLPVAESSYINSKYAFYEAVLPDALFVAKMVAWNATPIHEWAMKVAASHKTRRSFRVYEDSNAGTTPVRVC